MSWIKTEYEFGSLFSYRSPDYPSPSYALSLPLPGPSTIKLAIVATAIETTCNIDIGKSIFEMVKNVTIKIKPPKAIALSNLLIKRLKSKKNAEGFESTFGVRGYVHISEPLTVYLDLSKSHIKDIECLLKKVRRLGTSDSLVYCTNISRVNSIPSQCIEAVSTLNQTTGNILLVPVKDLNPKISFDEINPYGSSLKKGVEPFIKKYYLLPLSKVIQGKNWIIYEIRQS